MLGFLPYPIKVTISATLLIIHVTFTSLFLLPFILLKAISPIAKIRDFLSMLIVDLAAIWAYLNYVIIESMGKIKWEIDDIKELNLDKKKNYLVVSNHQSWVDIFVLMKVFNLKIPYFRFFLKDSLRWVPFMGFVWWGMDYPFMKRYSKAQIKANPKLKDANLNSAQKSCKRFEQIPVSVMNFLEGTRFTEEKHKKTSSPFKHLLKPRAGGISLVLSALNTLDTILNVTIIYPDNKKNLNFWKFVAGDLNHIIIKIERIPIEKNMIGDYANDAEYRENFQNWSNDLWQKKDELIESIVNPT